MERDYKPADIALLLDKIRPYAALDIDSPFPHQFVPVPQYEPNEQEQALLEEYRTNPRLTSAVHAVQRMSYMHVDSAGLDANEVRKMMSIASQYNTHQLKDIVYHLWQKCLEIESGMSIYELAPKMGF